MYIGALHGACKRNIKADNRIIQCKSWNIMTIEKNKDPLIDWRTIVHYYDDTAEMGYPISSCIIHCRPYIIGYANKNKHTNNHEWNYDNEA